MGLRRRERVAGQLLAFLAEEVRRLADPSLAFVTLTAVDVAADLKSARVYWTSLVSLEDPDGISAAFGRAAGYLKKKIAAELKLRFTPELFFFCDEAVTRGSRVECLLDSL